MNGTQPDATLGDAENETAKRAADLFARIDALKPKRSAETVFRGAMESGATTKEEFAKAYEAAGIDPERASAIGLAINAHLRIVALEKTLEIPKSPKEMEESAAKTEAQPARFRRKNAKAIIAREWLVFLPLFALGGVLCYLSYFYQSYYPDHYESFWDDYFGFHPQRHSNAHGAGLLWFVPYVAVMLARSVYSAIKALTRS
jgi:hypothetical protein